jgi:hypothetical protein
LGFETRLHILPQAVQARGNFRTESIEKPVDLRLSQYEHGGICHNGQPNRQVELKVGHQTNRIIAWFRSIFEIVGRRPGLPFQPRGRQSTLALPRFWQ